MMKRSRFLSKTVIVAVLLAIVFGAWIVTMHDPPPDQVHDAHNATHKHVEPTETAEDHTKSEGKVVWTCSMHPQIQLPNPGKCPICFMDLIKLDIDTSGETSESYRQIKLDSDERRLAQIKVTPVVLQPASTSIRLVGKVDYDESLVSTISAWTAGRIEKMFIAKTGSLVRKGQPMAAIYSPELYAAQAELNQAVAAQSKLTPQSSSLIRNSIEQTIAAAKEKLRLLGLTRSQITAIIKQSRPSKDIVISAPQAGIVIRKDVVEGAYVKTGQPIYHIVDLSKVWVVLEAYETDLPWVHEGDDVAFTVEAFPGERFYGRVVYIDTMVNQKTRTVDIRLEVENPHEKLKPGMFVQAYSSMQLAEHKKSKEFLVIPDSAPLITGQRAVVYVEHPEKKGVYEGREIVLGPKIDDFYVVKHGLKEGEYVVSNGAFKLDSALQIKAKPSMMGGATTAAPQAGHAGHGGHDQQDAHDQHATHSVQPAQVSEPLNVPLLLASKLTFLQVDFDALAQALQQQNNAQVRSIFRKIGKKIASFDSSMLEGEAKLIWKEYTMLLANDCVLGAEAENNKRQRKIYSSAKSNYEALRRTLGIKTPATSLTSSMHVPTKFKKQLGHVLIAYVGVSEALGKDDVEGARKAASRVITALAKVSSSELTGQANSFWRTQQHKFSQSISAIQGASDISIMREQFSNVSKILLSVTEEMGIVIPGELYEIYCPMAFDNKGAIWLQQDEDIRNPYLGKAMFKCGEVKRQISVE